MGLFINPNGLSDEERKARAIFNAKEFQEKLPNRIKIISNELSSIRANFDMYLREEDYSWLLNNIAMLQMLIDKRNELEKVYIKLNELMKNALKYKRIIYGDLGEEFLKIL